VDRNLPQHKLPQEFVSGRCTYRCLNTINFRCTSEYGNADALSWLTLQNTIIENDVPPEIVLLIDHLYTSPVTASQLRQCTTKNPEISVVLEYEQHGWPNKSAVMPKIIPYYQKIEETSMLKGCPLWGARVVVPKALRANVLTHIHECHPGVT